MPSKKTGGWLSVYLGPRTAFAGVRRRTLGARQGWSRPGRAAALYDAPPGTQLASQLSGEFLARAVKSAWPASTAVRMLRRGGGGRRPSSAPGACRRPSLGTCALAIRA